MRFFLLIVLLHLISLSQGFADTVYYVDANSAGGDGSAWEEAFSDLQDALAVATDGDEIWVAEGTYYPTDGDDRNALFHPATGVSMYGGFTNGMNSLAERDWNRHKTILSGDVGVKGDHSDNSYHIVRGDNPGTRMDGFHLFHGRATGGSGHMRQGAAVYLGSGMTIANCVFVNNISLREGIILHAFHIKDSVFVDNNPGYGGVIYITSGAPLIERCVFAGTDGGSRGAVIRVIGVDSAPMVRNCVFVGNRSRSGSGVSMGILSHEEGAIAHYENCTLFRNASRWSTVRGAVYNTSVDTGLMTGCTFTNSILWGSYPRDIYHANSTSCFSRVAYTAMSETPPDIFHDVGGNMVGIDPLFGRVETGVWTADAVYDDTTVQTLLTDAAASWQPGELVDCFVRTDAEIFDGTETSHAYLIVSNSATTITVWGDASTGMDGRQLDGMTYELIDVHLKSKYGRHTALGWVLDDVCSPCIDAGDPDSDWSLEADYSGRRVNMGAYGNTPQSSKSLAPGMLFFSH